MLRWIAPVVAFTTGLLCSSGGAMAAESAPTGIRQSVRVTPEFDEPWLQQGVCRSATFRELVANLTRSDVIVYVQPRFLSSQSLAGGLQFVSVTPTARILRIVINLKVLGTDRSGAIATLGHELRHALEVSNAPEIRSVETFNEYYRRHQVDADRYDTAAARHTERYIRAELFRSSEASCPAGRQPA